VGTETDLTAVGALLRYAKSAVDVYSAPDRRADLKLTWEQGLRKLLEAAEPGSDHQLALARGYGSAVLTPEGLDFARGLYDGTVTLDGLVLDQDLRWTVLKSLAYAGRATEDEIDAELARDHTISGQEWAAGCRTVRPTVEAKAQAWHDAVEREDVPNETQRQIAVAFQVTGQEELLKPYIARYLEAAETIVEERSVWIARVVLENMFPRALPTQETLDAVNAWLESTPAGPAALRYVKEGKADLERALRAQAKDAEVS